MFPLIDLAGRPFERGRMHGALAKPRVERSLANYAELFASCGLGWSEVRRLGASFGSVIGGLDPRLLEEIEGIAAGAGRGVDEILALNARTEILPPSYLSAQGECTAVAVRPGASATGGTLLAQNWDWIGAQRGALILLRARGEFVTLTEAGMLAKIGLNRHGFGVCLNILRSTGDGKRPGVPVHVLLRALLGRTGVEDAIGFASKLSFGGSSNVLCADAKGDAASLEFSPNGLRVLRAETDTLCHTNHFIAPGTEGWQATLADNLSTVPRLERARAHAAACPKLGLEDVKRLLRDETAGLLSICRHPDPSLPEQARIESVASVIMELARGVMHVAPDVPSKTEYRAIALEAEPVVQ